MIAYNIINIEDIWKILNTKLKHWQMRAGQ